jgi:hypothetical protein
LWSIDALIDRDLTVLRNGWPRCWSGSRESAAGNSAPWALSILEVTRKLDDLLNVRPPGSAKELQRWQMKSAAELHELPERWRYALLPGGPFAEAALRPAA